MKHAKTKYKTTHAGRHRGDVNDFTDEAKHLWAAEQRSRLKHAMKGIYHLSHLRLDPL